MREAWEEVRWVARQMSKCEEPRQTNKAVAAAVAAVVAAVGVAAEGQ